MSNVIIEHKDGRRYGTTTEGFARLRDTDYAGFKIVGEETPADFEVTGIPAAKAKRAHARKKAAAPVKSAPAVKASEPVVETTSEPA